MVGLDAVGTARNLVPCPPGSARIREENRRRERLAEVSYM
jgi:hypothetical protein